MANIFLFLSLKTKVASVNKEIKKEESKMDATMYIERPCTILKSIEKSCQEVKLMREGKIPKRSWNDFMKRMEDESAKDE